MMRKSPVIAALALVAGVVLALIAGAARNPGGETAPDPGPDEVVSSRAYRGHESELDMKNLVAAYPDLAGTRLDDCQTCHRGGEVFYPGRTTYLNPCSYCHLIPYPDRDVISGAPGDYTGTLNPFGGAYAGAGRSREALALVGRIDSDGDGFSNEEEIHARRYPGDAESIPGQPLARAIHLAWEDLHARARHRQFLLLNSHKQLFDSYADYAGVKLIDLLEASGVDLARASGVTVLAPDGFARDFTLADISRPYPPGLYYAGWAADSSGNPAEGFVTYPDRGRLPAGLVDGGAIPGEQWLMIAFSRDGIDLDMCYPDPATGAIEGEGPYRLIVPQSVPGPPDRGSGYSPSGYDDGHDYDPAKDHNAGSCVRGVVAVRINPMPGGYEEFDWKNGGWALVSGRELVIYGQGVSSGN